MISAVVETITTSLVLTEPAGVADGDLLIVCIASRSTATTAPSAAGWNLVQQQNNNNTATNNTALASGIMAYRVRSGAPTLTFTLPAGISVAMGRILAYRGNAATTPLENQGSVTTATNTTAVNVAGMTTTTPGDLIVVMLAGGQEALWSGFNNATNPLTASGATDTTTPPSTTAWIERADTNTVSGADTSLGIFDSVKLVPGATGNVSVTASVAAGHVLIAGAFKPSATYVSVTAPGSTAGTTAPGLSTQQKIAVTTPAMVAATTAPTVTATVGGWIKVWTGSAWVKKPAKVWTGVAWVAKPNKKWNGSAWV